MFSELAAAELTMAEWGNKAARLSIAARAGFPVPPALCLQASAVRHSCTAIAAWLACYDPDTVVVRTSAVWEDTSQRAFAGGTLTGLGVPADPAAIRDVALDHIKDAADSPMGRVVAPHQGLSIIVQQQVRPTLAGVAFCDVTGFTAEFSRFDTQAVTSGAIPQGRLERREGTSATASGELAPWIGLAENLARTGRELRSVFGFALDLEWAWLMGALIVLQVRPITVSPAWGPHGSRAPGATS